MLAKLELQDLQTRRSSKTLIILHKVVEGLVPVIEPDENLKTTLYRYRFTICIAYFGYCKLRHICVVFISLFAI